jgi:tRNA pseudouridine55 synthase
MRARIPSGVLVLDKPTGISSAKAVRIVKSTLNAGKVGHTGTLDPMATGALICCINHATKLSGFFLAGRKTYEAVMVLGIETDTQDATGKRVAERDVDLGVGAAERIQSVFEHFVGSGEQLPPVFSALKHAGVPLYKYARQGKPIQKPAKRIHIDRLDIQSIDLPEIRFRVSCSAGTYIRTLCADIGRTLGCGAHLAALRRTASSAFSVEQAVRLDRLADLTASGEIFGRIIRLSDLLQHIPAVKVSGKMAASIRNGIVLSTVDLPGRPEVPPAGYLRILTEDRSLVAVLRRRNDSDRFDYRCIIPAEQL